jgi:hypothetical protein
MMGSQLRDLVESYLEDDLRRSMWAAIRAAKPIRSISVDITRRCNLRCTGCYFFAEGMDASRDADDETLEAFVVDEVARGTNFVTVIGGEPSLALSRLRRLYGSFRLMTVTNGLRKIPFVGFEDMPISVSVWGDRAMDRELRGYGKIDVFDRALANYQGDPRVVWYFSLVSGSGPDLADVVKACVANGNMVGFNFYGDISGVGGACDHKTGFAGPRRIIDDLIGRFPESIVISRHLSEVISTGRLLNQQWGYDVCGSITANHPKNRERVANGAPFNSHFRAYNADLHSTRRCCVGDERDCATCYDVWAHMSWVMLNFSRHLSTQSDFTNWLEATYLFYGVNRLVPYQDFRRALPHIHARRRHTEAAA